MSAAVDDRVLRLVRVFNAPPERVFAAWTNAEQFGAWFGPPGMKTEVCEVDARVGGMWRLIGEGHGMRPAVSGKYLEVDPPRRLVFTFAWHEKDDFATPRGYETTVRVEFRPIAGGKTEMTMIQSDFPDRAATERHNRGWTGSFDKLEDFLRRPS